MFDMLTRRDDSSLLPLWMVFLFAALAAVIITAFLSLGRSL